MRAAFDHNQLLIGASMPKAIDEFEKLAAAFTKIEGVSASQMFGKPCLKINGKAFLAQHKETVVFKLTDPDHAKALALPGAMLWDPSGKNRPMKEWVALSATESSKFSR